MLQQMQKLLEKMIADGVDQSAIDAMKKIIEKEKQRSKDSSNEFESEMDKIYQASLSANNKFIIQQKELILNHQKELKALKQQDLSNLTDDEKKQIQIKYNTLQEEIKIFEQRKETIRSINNWFESNGLVTNFSDSKTGKFLSDIQGAFAALGASMSDALKPANLFAAGVDQMISATKQLFTSFDQAQADLSKMTATTGEYNDMLYDLQESNKTFGVDSKIAGEAIGNLHKELSSFNQMSSATQGMLAETTARMDALGVSTGVGAKQFDNMIQGMGMSATMANDASLELVALGDAIGMAAETISSGFNAAASELAKYGSEAIDVFKGLASAAKATGIEMSALMSITKQYDTFEGAAQGAGKLNAILGGGVVNSMDLLNATEEERIRLLIQSMSLSGKNWESLNRFEKQAIASAAGISDMTEANKMFSMSLSAYDEMQAKGSEANAEAAKMEERAQAVQTLQQKLTQIGQAFAVAFMPVLEFFHGFANMILMINDMTGGMFIPAMVGLIGVIALLGKTQAISNAITQVSIGIQAASAFMSGGLAAAQSVLAGTTAAQGTAATVAAPANAGFAASLTAISVAAAPLIPMVTAIGLAIAGIGLAIAAPFIALAAVVTAFKELFLAMMEAPKAIGAAVVGLLAFAVAGAAAMVILSYGMIAAVSILSGFAPMMLIVAPALLSFAFAMAVAGAAMYLAGAGLKSFGEGLAAFNAITFEGLMAAIVSLTLFAIGLVAFAGFASPVMIAVGFGLMLFGAGLKSFAKGLAEFNKVGLKEMFTAVGALLLFSLLMIEAALPIAAVALLVGIPLMMIGAGLKSFAKGLAEFNKVGLEEMFIAAGSLLLFSALMIEAALPIAFVALVVAVPLMMISLALGMFAENLRNFNKVGAKEIFTAAGALLLFGLLMVAVAVPITVGATLMSLPLMLFGVALASFGFGLQQFEKVGLGALLIAITALVAFGIAMKFLFPFLPAMIVGFQALTIPMITFGAALMVVGAGLLMIGAGMKIFSNLSETLAAIAEVGAFGAAVMGMLAISIMGIAFAMMLIPESKTLAFGFAMEGYGAALAAVQALTPETTELAERVVTAAGEYAEIQAEMKMPDEDSFVQAMKNAFGLGDKKGKQGQDIILQLNGRELGRAVDAQLNKMHNLRID